ncbi:MAG TPA: dihydroxyacetone kinase subunit DhaL [Candidatus Sulfotelmatobacter sp.]|nr:dihydroxyacetone kinase subunit DhaL [Candidatus Sulfotelmatobacter sp.]
MDSFANQNGRVVIENVIAAVRDNAALLSEIDGAVGDGDHGVNMAKGFGRALEKIGTPPVSLSEGMAVIGSVLLTEIGGAMGPLYGALFRAMSRACKDSPRVDAAVFESMLRKAEEAVVALGNAKVGDKTMLDTLAPAVQAFADCRRLGLSFAGALSVMMKAAEEGKESTRDLVARVGRSSRLGERSRGTLDAGAVSCWLILTAMGRAMMDLLSR